MTRPPMRADVVQSPEQRADAELQRRLVSAESRADSLERLCQATPTIMVASGVEDTLRALVDGARHVLRCGCAFGWLAGAVDGTPARDAHAAQAGSWDTFDPKLLAMGIFAELAGVSAPRLLGAEEVRQRLARAPLPAAATATLSSCLAVPLLGRDAATVGLVQVYGKYEGEWTADDEALLLRLAEVASLSLASAQLYDTLRERDRRKDEFLATLAHELRNPLAPVRSGLELLRALGTSDGRLVKAREMMERQTAHLVRLVEDLMDVARISRGKITLQRDRVRLGTLFDAAIETSRPALEAGAHRLDVELRDPHAAVDGDPTRLAQVLSNLLNNAAKYTPDRGHIVLSGGREDGQVVIRVRDDGVGIPPDMLPKVFELFTQVGRNLERAQGGLGIGLSLASALVELHGGTLTAESAGPECGAMFTIRLPAAPAVLDDLSAPAAPAPASRPLPSLRVLIVDDNADAADMLAALLELSGVECKTASSGLVALKIALEWMPRLVLLDLGLPGMSGFDVIAELRRHLVLASTCVVAVTGWGSDEDRKRSKAAGFDDHLTKPVDHAQVLQLIEHVAHQVR